ncbi:MAG: 4-(cytidine 5'-diphospho)-2-C-methyl-D-erythritol kinase [Candidatus Muiribacteriaceae bacterium]
MKDILYSPAKINLSLDLLYKRKDGFHEIDTLMLKIDLCDVIEITDSSRTEVICGIASGKENLVYKAIKNLETVTGKIFPVSVKIKKNIPAGAGLAGGSSNAGTVLRYLGQRYGILSEKLFEAGAMTGADVNFFVNDASFARCMGKGEIIIPIPSVDNLPDSVYIIKPDIHADTVSVYKEFRIEEYRNTFSIDTLLYYLTADKWEEVENNLFNALESPAFKLYNGLQNLYRKLSSDCRVRMSGSGAAFFTFSPEPAIEEKQDLFVYKANIWRNDA